MLAMSDWRIVLGRPCSICHGTGFVHSQSHTADGKTIAGQGRCKECMSGVQVKIATKKDIVSLIPQLMKQAEDALVEETEHRAKNTSPCLCGDAWQGNHQVTCRFY